MTPMDGLNFALGQAFTASLNVLGVWAVPVLVATAAALGIAVALFWMKKADSPFIKIARDAVAAFAADPHLRLLPPAVALAGVLSFGVALQISTFLPPGWSLVVRTPGSQWLTVRWETILLCAIASAQLAALGVAAANAVLADCFIERAHGRPARFFASAARVARRLPRLLVFTFLWSALLAAVVCVRLQLESALRRGKRPLGALLLDFAGFALETGIVMAAYLMLVVMLREDIDPITAMRRTLEIVKDEYASTVGELASLAVLDEAMLWMTLAAGVAGQMAAFWLWQARYPAAPLEFVEIMAGLFTVTAAMLVGGTYYAVIQTLQLLLACAVFLFVHDGVMVDGFSRADFENVLCLKVSKLPEGVLGPDTAGA